MNMQQAAEYMNAKLIGENQMFDGVSIDSRQIGKDNLFFAIKGENYDGHDFVPDLAEANVAGVVVEKEFDISLPQLLVKDTRLALGQLAKGWRSEFEYTKFIGITGSNGKTTVKEMVFAILSESFNTYATHGNFNNEIGVPLTLFEADKSLDFAVIEMGANHIGEIDYLANIAKPHVGLVNNAGTAHIEGFGSVEGIAQGKGEIYTHIQSNGFAVFNLDDRYAKYWQDLNLDVQQISYSLEGKTATIKGDYASAELKVTAPFGDINIQLPLLGKHNARNALAAIAIASAFNIDKQDIKNGLEKMQAVKGRLQPNFVGKENLLIDDTYNANLEAFKAAIDVLVQLDKPSCLIMGDMAELGVHEQVHHQQVGEYAKQQGVHELYACGDAAKYAANAFGENGYFFADKNQLQTAIKDKNYQGSVFLIKGSRSARMESVFQYLLDLYQPEVKK